MRQPGGAPTATTRAGTPAAPPPYTPPPRTSPPVVRTVPTPPPMAAPPPPRTPAAALPTSGTFRWASSLREAQDAARATGRMVFIETGRPACGNCQALRNDVIPNPAVSGELGAASVGYYTDCDVEPNAQAYLLLTRNLPNAATLPLVGFFTPDLRFVHGYSGGRNVARFRQEIATARAAYQRLASVDGPASSFLTAALPTRGLGSLPDAELADVSLELADDRMLDVAAVGGEASPDRALAVAPTAPTPSGPSVAELAAAAATAEGERLAALEAERIAAEDRERAALAAALRAAPALTGTAIVSPRSMPPLVPAAPVEPPASLEPANPEAEPTGAGATPPVEAAAPTDVRTWAQAELLRAAKALSTGDYASARAILAWRAGEGFRGPGGPRGGEGRRRDLEPAQDRACRDPGRRGSPPCPREGRPRVHRVRDALRLTAAAKPKPPAPRGANAPRGAFVPGGPGVRPGPAPPRGAEPAGSPRLKFRGRPGRRVARGVQAVRAPGRRGRRTRGAPSRPDQAEPTHPKVRR